MLVIREGGIADLGAVIEVMEDSFDPAYGEAWTAPQCSGLLPMPGVWLALACEGGATCGFSLARVVADEAELLLLAVRRAAQGRGTGRRLLDHFLEAAARRGAKRFHLEMRDGNSARLLYESAGFKPAGRRRNYYSGPGGHAYDALTLARSHAP